MRGGANGGIQLTWRFMWRLIPKASPWRPHRPTVSSHVRRAVRAATAAASQQVTGALSGHGSSSSSRSLPGPEPDRSGDASSSPLSLSLWASSAGCGRQLRSRQSRTAPADAAAAAAAAATAAAGIGGVSGFGAARAGRKGFGRSRGKDWTKALKWRGGGVEDLCKRFILWKGRFENCASLQLAK